SRRSGANGVRRYDERQVAAPSGCEGSSRRERSRLVTVEQSAPSAPPEPPAPLERTFSAASVATAVAENDLEQIGVRPPLGTYFLELWRYRHLVQVMAISHSEAAY